MSGTSSGKLAGKLEGWNHSEACSLIHLQVNSGYWLGASVPFDMG